MAVSLSVAKSEKTSIKVSDSSRKILEKEIEKIPEFELLPVFTERDELFSKQQKFRGVTEKGKDDAIAVVRDKYALVQMRDIFNRVLFSLDEDVRGDVIYYRGRGQLHIFPKDSDIGMCVLNSVDASSAIKVFFVKRENGTTVYLPFAAEIEGIREYKRLHVGRPLDEVTNFSKILLDAQTAWGFVVDAIAKVPLTSNLAEEIKKSLDTKMLVEVVDGFATNNLDRHFGRSPTLWDLLLAIMKTASASKFKSEIHREKRLRELSTLLVALALKMS